LSLLDEAEAAAGPKTAPSLLTWLHARRAEDFAAYGDSVATQHSLDRADRSFNLVRGSNEGFFSNWSSGRMSGYRANAAVLLNRPDEAARIVGSAVSRTPATLANERCFLLIVLATVRAKQSELEESCALLSEVFLISQRAGLVERAHRIKRVRLNQLPGGEGSPELRQLDDQLR